MPIPAVLTASLPVLRMAGAAVVAASSWTAACYATDKLIRKADKNAFGASSKATLSPEKRREALQASLLLQLKEERGHKTLSQALEDPVILAAIQAVEAAQTGPAIAPQAARKAA